MIQPRPYLVGELCSRPGRERERERGREEEREEEREGGSFTLTYDIIAQ